MPTNYYKDGNCIIKTIGVLDLPKISEAEYNNLMAKVTEKIDGLSTAAERRRPLTAEEVTRLLIAQQINSIPVDDYTALRMLEFYPEWAAGQAYPAGYKVQRGGKLCRCLQAHTSQTGWEPENTPSLWEYINEQHTGDQYDPIPYDGNMELTAGLYYAQGGVVYLCNRNTGQPVYNALADLVGIYVEVVM